MKELNDHEKYIILQMKKFSTTKFVRMRKEWGYIFWLEGDRYHNYNLNVNQITGSIFNYLIKISQDRNNREFYELNRIE